VLIELTLFRQWFNRHLFHARRWSVMKAYTPSFVCSRFRAPVKLTTRYTTADTALEINSTSATVK